VLILLWKNDFGLLAGRGGWGLDEDDVDMLVSPWNSDDAGLGVYGLIRGGVDIDVTESLWDVGGTTVFGAWWGLRWRGSIATVG